MISIRFKKLFFENKMVLIISIFLLLFLCTFKINTFILVFQLQGFSLYIVLIQIGTFIMSLNKIKIIKQISRLSYGIYLFHHCIILDILGLNNPIEWYLHLSLLGITIILTIVCSSIHFMVVNSVINSSLFNRLDKLFLI